MNQHWVPEILYEEDDAGLTGQLPFIPVPENEEMPGMLFIFEQRETGEFEPGPEGEELPIFEVTLHSYAQMAILRERLSAEDFDKVRVALGLLPLKQAIDLTKKQMGAV